MNFSAFSITVLGARSCGAEDSYGESREIHPRCPVLPVQGEPEEARRPRRRNSAETWTPARRPGSMFRRNCGDAGAALLRVLLEREAQDIVDEFLGFLHNCPRRALLRRGWGGRLGGLGFEAGGDRVRLRVGASAFPDSFARLSSAR